MVNFLKVFRPGFLLSFAIDLLLIFLTLATVGFVTGMSLIESIGVMVLVVFSIYHLLVEISGLRA